jgi:hypothetical protein
MPDPLERGLAVLVHRFRTGNAPVDRRRSSDQL